MTASICTYTYSYPWSTHNHTHIYTYIHTYIHIELSPYIVSHNHIHIISIYQQSLIFFTLLTRIHFRSVHGLALLLNIGPNGSMISSSYHHEVLMNGHFQFLGYHSTTAWIHLLCINFTCPVQWNFCFWYSTIILHSTLESCSDIPSMETSIALCVITSHWFSFFVEAVSLAYYNIIGKIEEIAT